MVTKLEKLLISEVSGVDAPANQLPGFMVVKASDFKSGRAIGPDQEWDVGAAEKRIREVTKAEDGPNPAYASCFLWYDGSASDDDEDGVPDNFGAYKFLVCDVVDGKVSIMPAAIRAASNRAEGASIPATDKDELLSATKALEKKAGIGEAAQKSAEDTTTEADEESATSMVAKIRGLLGFAGKADLEMTRDEFDTAMDERLEAFATALVAKLAPSAEEETAKAEAPAEAAAEEEGVSKDAADGEKGETEAAEAVAEAPAETAEVEKDEAAETPAYVTEEQLTAALEPHLKIFEGLLGRVEGCEAALTTRKSLDGQDGEPEAAAEGDENTVAKAIEKAFRR